MDTVVLTGGKASNNHFKLRETFEEMPDFPNRIMVQIQPDIFAVYVKGSVEVNQGRSENVVYDYRGMRPATREDNNYLLIAGNYKVPIPYDVNPHESFA